MRQLWVIISWEFFRHFKSRSFLIATFISPLIFSLIILIPSFFLSDTGNQVPRIIGCVELDSTRICEKIKSRLDDLFFFTNQVPTVHLVKIEGDTTDYLRAQFQKVARLKTELDSLENVYNTIKERRKYIYQKPKTRTREKLLRQTYEELLQARESRDMASLEYEKEKARIDSAWYDALIRKADQLLRTQVLEGYILVNRDDFEAGRVEFHSLLPAGFLQIEPLRHALQVAVVEERLSKEGIRVDKIQEWLHPVEIREIQLQGENKQEFDFMVNYLGPIILVLFLFISIFTSSGFLFNGVLKEKTNRVIEILLSSVSTLQLMTGKILALGFLGILQILIWFSLTALLIGLQVLNIHQINFLTIQNAGLFLLYFMLGYLYFASIFVGVGSLFSSEEDAHHLNQFMRLLSIFPILLAILVLEIPNSLVVRLLSFIPPLTPTFMILRTPFGNPPQIDYLISSGIMVVAIIVNIFFAARLFKIGSLLYGKKPTFREIFKLAFSKL